AGSLLTALELPELITTSAAEYQERAIELARDPPRLDALRQTLLANRLSTRLFDTRSVVRSLETAYLEIHRREQAGLPADHIRIETQEPAQPRLAQTLESGNEALRRLMEASEAPPTPPPPRGGPHTGTVVLPQRVGALCHILRAFRLPLLDAVVIRKR